MSGVVFERGSGEWEMFKDCYRFAEKYWVPEDNEEYWRNLVEDYEAFIQKHAAIPLAAGIGLAVVKYLEDRAKAV